MVVNDPLKSFDEFLDSVTRMHDAIIKFSIDVEGKNIPAEPKFDTDHASLKELDEFTISEDSDDNNEPEFDIDDSGGDSDVDTFNASSEILTWLENKCSSLNNGSLTSDDLFSTVLGILTSDSQDDELQISLPEILGYENLDFVIDLIAKRSDIIAAHVSISPTLFEVQI